MCDFKVYSKSPLDYLNEGLLVPEICEKIGLTKHELLRLHRGKLIIYVKKLNSEGKTLKEIAKLMGVSYDTVKKLRKEDENLYKPVSEILKREIIELSASGLNPRSIRSKLSIPTHRIYEALKDKIILTIVQQNLSQAIKDFKIDSRDIIKLVKPEGYIIPDGGTSMKITKHYQDGEFPFYKPISNYLRDVIEGELLGDGHIANTKTNTNHEEKTDLKIYKEALNNLKEFNKAKSLDQIENVKDKYNKSIKVIEKIKTSSFVLHKAIKELRWAEFIKKIFQENGYRTNLRVNEDDCFSEANSSVQLQKIHEQWYDGKKRILPEELSLNPTKVLHWYEGDGSYNKKPNRICLNTQNFTKEEVNRLTDNLNKEIGINSKFYKEQRRDGEGNKLEGYYYRMWVSRNADVEKFFNYLEKADERSLEEAKKVVSHKFNIESKSKSSLPV